MPPPSAVASSSSKAQASAGVSARTQPTRVGNKIARDSDTQYAFLLLTTKAVNKEEV